MATAGRGAGQKGMVLTESSGGWLLDFTWPAHNLPAAGTQGLVSKIDGPAIDVRQLVCQEFNWHGG